MTIVDVYRREAVAIEAGSGSDEAPWSHRFVRAERTPNHSCSIGGGCEATAAEYDSPIHSVFDTCPFPLFCSVFSRPPAAIHINSSSVKFLTSSYFPELLSWRPATRPTLSCACWRRPKIGSKGLSPSGHRLFHQLLDCNFMFRDTFPSSVLIDGHQGVGFSDQFIVEV